MPPSMANSPRPPHRPQTPAATALCLAAAGALAALAAGCASSPQHSGGQTEFIGDRSAGRAAGPGAPAAPDVQDDGFWRDPGTGGAPKIVIDLGAQRAFFYRGATLVGDSPVSTGREGYRTPAGTFSVTQKNPDHRSNVYGNFVDPSGNVVASDVDVRSDRKPPGTRFDGAPMPYFMRFNGGVGMHAGYLPGFAASHGCVRLPRFYATKFYHNASHGTPVVVRR